MSEFETAVLERPKSQILIWHNSSINILAGFISQCKIFAEWMNFKAHSELYNMIVTWLSENIVPWLTDDSAFLKSVSISS